MDSSRDWIGAEVLDGQFKDERLGKRCREILGRLSDGPGQTIPFACQDWANTKGAYRFFANDRVSEDQILAGHFRATRERVAALSAAQDTPLLILHDTTEFSYKRENPSAIGITGEVNSGKTREGRTRLHTVCGVLMHSSLVVTPEGLPLGLAAIKFWTRDHFYGASSIKRIINPTRVPIQEKESYRWLLNIEQSSALLGVAGRCVHIGDREADIYELFYVAQEVGSHFVVRTCADRLAGNGDHTVAQEMAREPCRGLHRVQIADVKGGTREVTLEIRYRRIRVLPPVGKAKSYPPMELSVVHVIEREASEGRERLQWKLLTDLPVSNLEQAIQTVQWYAMRWKIEVFHKILKSGCKAEDSRLRSAQRLVNLIALLCIVSWRIFWLTMLNRVDAQAKPGVALTLEEIEVLDRLVPEKTLRSQDRMLGSYLLRLARLGGYLARAHDPPPGNMVIWRGMTKLTDITLGFRLARGIVGN